MACIVNLTPRYVPLLDYGHTLSNTPGCIRFCPRPIRLCPNPSMPQSVHGRIRPRTARPRFEAGPNIEFGGQITLSVVCYLPHCLSTASFPREFGQAPNRGRAVRGRILPWTDWGMDGLG